MNRKLSPRAIILAVVLLLSVPLVACQTAAQVERAFSELETGAASISEETEMHVPPTVVEYANPESGLHMHYPIDWQASNKFGTLIFASDASLIGRNPDTLVKGAIVMAFAAPSQGEVDVLGLLETFMRGRSEAAKLVQHPHPTKINGHKAALAEYVEPGSHGSLITYIVAYIYDGERTAVVMGAVTHAEESRYLEAALTIVHSVTLQQPQLPQDYYQSG